MKKSTSLLFIIFAILILCTACIGEKVDFESPEALVEAYETKAIPKDTHDSQLLSYGYSDSFEGKTFKVKTNNAKNEGDTVLLYESGFKSRIFVTLKTYGDKNFDYKKGDTVVVKVDFISVAEIKSNGFKDYYITANLP